HVAIGTGLRANEIRTRRRCDYQVDRVPFTVAVPAKYSKRGEDDVVELDAELAGRLRAFFQDNPLPPAARPFNVHDRSAAMLRRDLAAARKAWVKELPGRMALAACKPRQNIAQNITPRRQRLL